MTAPADSDSDFPPRVAIPWWRHRRRLFYLVTGLFAIALPWGGWHWWYRANFPMPIRQVERMLPPVAQWLGRVHLKLVELKSYWETCRLRPEGTSWKEVRTGVKLSFGDDGLIRFENPSGALFLLPVFSWEGPNVESNEASEGLDGNRYHFQPRMTPFERIFVIDRTGTLSHSNLHLPDSPWRGLLLYEPYGDRIQLLLIPKNLSGHLEVLHGYFTRLPDP